MSHQPTDLPLLSSGRSGRGGGGQGVALGDVAPASRGGDGPERTESLGRSLLRGHPANASEAGLTVESLDEHCARIGRKIDAHSHRDCVQIILVASGSGTMAVDEIHQAFAAPSILILPTNVVHAFRYTSDVDGWVVSITTNYLNQVLPRAGELHEIWYRAGSVFCDGKTSFPDMLSYASRLHEELRVAQLAGRIACEAFLVALLVEALRLCRRHRGGVPLPRDSKEIAKRYLELVEVHFADNLTIDQYCSLMHVTSAQLRAACGGSTPLSILHERILAEAKRRLSYTRVAISEIGYSLGFDDPSYFARFFKKKVGESPASYRLRGVGVSI